MYRAFGKRGFDILTAGTGLILLSPVIVLTSLAVAIALGRPVVFRQRRPGLGGRLFSLVKFRTMTSGTDETGRVLPDDRRLTPFGRLLRSTSLDELPELWNVLAGDMSMVGPRPLLPQYIARYSPRQARRHDVRPGMTGLAQVSGRNALDWESRLELDVQYVDRVSLSLDLWILVVTVWQVLTRRGISQEGRATVDEFRGQSQP
jgi:sugar transferase EpsL